MLPCFLAGFFSRLVASMSRAVLRRRRVSLGADDRVDVAALGGNVGVREALAELFGLLGAGFGKDGELFFFGEGLALRPYCLSSL